MNRHLAFVGVIVVAGCVGEAPPNDGGEVGDEGAAGHIEARVDECEHLAPSGDPLTNATAIQACLNDVGRAVLEPGEYPISLSIDMPPSAALVGADPAARPTLIKLPGGGTNYVINFGADS